MTGLKPLKNKFSFDIEHIDKSGSTYFCRNNFREYFFSYNNFAFRFQKIDAYCWIPIKNVYTLEQAIDYLRNLPE